MKLKLKKSQVAVEVRKSLADHHESDKLIEAKQPPETREIVTDADDESRIANADRKLSRLIEGDFPFDESQLEAIEGLATEQYACLTGAAGTGKTTVTKAIVDSLLDEDRFAEVNMREYFKRGEPAPDDGDEDTRDESEKPTWVPSVAMVAFTGRASQMIKKNFPADWHSNIMTIHRLLAYVPEFYEDFDEESHSFRKKMRFAPTYTADFRLPWDHIIVDEAGMLSVDLWENLWAACKPGCRITLIGDINQLPPVHGKSVFGFAMSKWPTWELKKVHRQKGENNPIVDNAWRIIHGQLPQNEGRFQMLELKGDAQYSSRQVRAILPKLRERGVYDPIRDTCITPINGEEGSRGFALGQLPLNREFATIFNPQNESPRYIIDGGRDRKQFAVGDKVMATKNDYEAGITNGMTGVITSIEANGAYAGDRNRFGTVEDVNAYIRGLDTDDAEVEFTLDDLQSDFEAVDKGMADSKEKKERGPSSHIVTVRFGSEEHGIEIPFASLSEVGSLMTAYVVTCHKMQGGEAPVVIIICHDSHKSMLYREWLYTAVTRAANKCILLYTPTALKTALNKQSIKGRSLKEKVESFNAIIGKVRVTLPDSDSTRTLLKDQKDEVFATPARLTTDAEKKGGLASLLKKQRDAADDRVTQPEHKTEARIKVDVTIRKTVTITTKTAASAPTTLRDGGDITPKRSWNEVIQQDIVGTTPRHDIPPIRQHTDIRKTLAKPECRDVVAVGPVQTVYQAARPEPLRLTHQPAPKPVNRLALKLNLKGK